MYIAERAADTADKFNYPADELSIDIAAVHFFTCFF